MKKILIALAILGGIAEAKDVNIESHRYNVFQGIEWNTNQWSNWLNNYIENVLLKAGNISTPISNIPLGKFLRNVWEGISCELPSFRGLINGLDVKIPSRISIELPCKTVYLDFSQDIRRIINETTTKINGYIPDWFQTCIYNPTNPDCVKIALNYYYAFDGQQIQGMAYQKYANMTNEEINQEIKKDSNALAQDIFPIITKKGETVYNNQILKADLGIMKEAGNSIGKFVYPDKKQVQGLPMNIKTAYAYAVGKQVVREEVIQMFQKRIDALFQELTAFKNVMDSYCGSDIPAVQVIPPSLGSVAYNNDIEKLKKVAINRCCCCNAIPAIHSAESHTIARISTAETNIITAIRQASLEIRTTIAQEMYNIRVQIHNEFMNYQANEKAYRCLKIKLDYLQLKTKLYDMMLKLAELETDYANLDAKEKKELFNLINSYFNKIK